MDEVTSFDSSSFIFVVYIYFHVTLLSMTVLYMLSLLHCHFLHTALLHVDSTVRIYSLQKLPVLSVTGRTEY
jgi:hypothetical protein